MMLARYLLFTDMFSLENIPISRFAIVSSLFFAALGAYDILVDLFANKLTAGHVAFNAIFFVSVVFRHRRVYRVFGWLAVLFAVYCALAIFVFVIQYLDGRHMRNVFGTFVEGPLFTLAVLAAGLILIRAGRATEQS